MLFTRQRGLVDTIKATDPEMGIILAYPGGLNVITEPLKAKSLPSWWPPEAGKGKETDSPLEALARDTALPTACVCPLEAWVGLLTLKTVMNLYCFKPLSLQQFVKEAVRN